MLWLFHTLWVCWVIHTMHCTVSGQANVPNQTQYNAFKCVLDLVSGLCFRGILFPWKSSKNKPQTCSSTLHAATIWHLTNKGYINWETVLLLFLTKAQVFFSSMRLVTRQSFILCLVRLQPRESSAAIAKLSVLALGLGRSKAASVLHALPEPVKRPQEFSHLLTKPEHTVMLKSRGINKQ